MKTERSSVTKVAMFVEDCFDYSHFLPEHDKCFSLHGHTSLVTLEISGTLADCGMIMDFADAKKILKEVLASFDHKLITNARYASSEAKAGMVQISYETFKFRLPREHVFLLNGEGTSEEIALTIADKLFEAMPPNVKSIRLTISEGLRKGTTVSKQRD